MTLYHQSLSDTLYDVLLKSQEQVFQKKRKKDFDTKSFNEKSFREDSLKSIQNPELHSNIKIILAYCFDYLQNKEIYNYDKIRYFIEFQQRNCFGIRKKRTFEMGCKS